jgi:catechol 2,3-dioxygenase-like lactoylglutathione lyase family enzyme
MSSGAGAGGPRVFRLLLASRDLARDRAFYETLLGTPGRVVAPGRVYFDAGPVILGVLDFSEMPPAAPPTEAVYLATGALDELHRRARSLGALATDLLHDDPDQPMGEIVVRPWGERSFYAADPSGNPLCFVDEATVFTGTPAQVERLREAFQRPSPDA